MLAPYRKRPFPLLACLSLALLSLFNFRSSNRQYTQWATSLEDHQIGLPANRTLGFGAIVAVSTEDSKRRNSLLQAANITDIDITIPQQPEWTENDVERFRNGETKNVQHGSILAWMGHRFALQWFLDTGLETALIIEDDVDWDVRLRSVQVPLAASAARRLMPPKRWLNSFDNDDNSQYWGNHKDWDLLYLGHCGDYFNEITEEGLGPPVRPLTWKGVEHIIYKDPSMLDLSELHPFTQALFNALRMPTHARAFHRSLYPLCSFGYAVTRSAAESLLRDLAPPKLVPNSPRAFDVALLHACSRGSKIPSSASWSGLATYRSKIWRGGQLNTGLYCWTLNSELFHHMPGDSEIAKIGERVGEVHGLPPVDHAGQSQVISRNESTNIGCGFWSGDFAFHNGDTERLELLRKEVAQKGRCLKHGRDIL